MQNWLSGYKRRTNTNTGRNVCVCACVSMCVCEHVWETEVRMWPVTKGKYSYLNAHKFDSRADVICTLKTLRSISIIARITTRLRDFMFKNLQSLPFCFSIHNTFFLKTQISGFCCVPAVFWCAVPCGSGRTSQRWRPSRRRRGCRKPCFSSRSRYSRPPSRCGDEAGICAWSWVLSAWGRRLRGWDWLTCHVCRCWELDCRLEARWRVNAYICQKVNRFLGWYESLRQRLAVYIVVGSNQCRPEGKTGSYSVFQGWICWWGVLHFC